MAKGIYIYPYSSKTPIEGSNPYIKNLMDSISTYIPISNYRPTRLGLLDLLRKLPSSKYILFNWVENISEKRFWLIQILLLWSIIYLSRLFNIKIVYLVHNKISHSKHRWKLKKWIFSFVANHSHVILTHASEGKDFITENIKVDRKRRIQFEHHPINKDAWNITESEHKEIDVLIWGTISPYKGVDKFLQELEESDSLNKFRIVIAGKFTNRELFEKVSKYASHNIKIINRFILKEELQDFISSTRVIMFTYQPGSVLSSGALMDSLLSRCQIIGPDVGAFKDLEQMGLIHTYETFNNIHLTLNSLLQNVDDGFNEKREAFIEANSWSSFSKNLCSIINSIE